MMKKGLWLAACMLLLGGCASGTPSAAQTAGDRPVMVGFSQVGAESEWRVTNTKSMKAALSEENGYELFFDDARNDQENQIKAIRTFILQGVDYIVFSPRVETGWTTVLQEAKDAGIPVIMIDRDIEPAAKCLITSFVGSDFRAEGEKAVKWLENHLEKQGKTADPVNIVHIQGTIGSTAQVGRTGALDDALGRHSNWNKIHTVDGDFTRAKAYEVMASFLTQRKDIDVVYCENDGEALGAIDAMEEAGLKCDAESGVIVISFDATTAALKRCFEKKIALDVECNPLQGPYVDEIIQKLERIKKRQSTETVEKAKYIEETVFDYITITQAMIEGREY